MGKMWYNSSTTVQPDLHAEIHQKLSLTDKQKQQIHLLEQEFSQQKNALEAKLKAANGSLSSAIAKDHELSADVSMAGKEYLQILGELQTATLNHIFKMRTVLDEQQVKTFDQIVVRSLHAAAK